jgi:potassium/hydrogen antiporter
MHLTSENILLVGAILLFISLLAGKTSFHLGIPVLVLFVAIGILAGSEGIGGIYFDSPRIAQFIGIVALNFILFSGGLDTSWQSVKPILWQGVTLSTIGVVITAASVGTFVWAVTDFTIYEGLLLGSIVSSTDSAAVFSILRSKSLALKGNLRPVLELESGSNDPMAYVLTIMFTGLVVNQDASIMHSLPLLFQQLILGGIMGYLFGKIGKWVINNIRIEYEGLYIVLVIAIMLFVFSSTTFAGGNGFLALYVCAIFLGNQNLVHKKKIVKSFDSFAWLMQIVLFLTLGLLVFPSRIVPVIGIGLLISAFLIVVARPVSVWISLFLFKVKSRSRWFISWVGLRGAVPIVFATYPLLAGAEKADMIFNIVFFVSLTSVLIQGTTLPVVAHWLHITLPARIKHRQETDVNWNDYERTVFKEMIVPADANAAGKPLVELNIPRSILISFIQRNHKYFFPDGLTVLLPGDKLFVLMEKSEDIEKLKKAIHEGHEEDLET